MTKDEELKPCPFCGGKAKLRIIRSGEDSENTFVECKDCFARINGYEGAFGMPDEAISEWNHRIKE